jgi:hypothetical protein
MINADKGNLLLRVKICGICVNLRPIYREEVAHD